MACVGLLLIPLAQANDTKVVTNYSPTEIDYPGTSVVFHVSEAFPQFKSDLGNYSSDGGKFIACRSIDDPDCTFDATSTGISRSVLPPCEDVNSSNCVAGLQITSTNGQSKSAKLVREIGGFTIPSDKGKGYIGGRSASIWSIESDETSTAGAVTEKYLIAAKFEAPWDRTKSSFGVEKISVSVFPIVEKAGDFFADRWATDEERLSSEASQFKGVPLQFIPKVRQGASPVDLRECLFFDEKYCGLHTVFRENARVKVDLRLTNEIGGWFHGRIKDPVISISSIDSLSNLVSVDAEAIMIPRFAHAVDYDSLDAVERRLFSQAGSKSGALPRDIYAGELADTGETAFSLLNSLREKVGDSAAGLTSTWNFTSIKAGSGSQCLSQKGKVLGIVSTNATAFESTAPKFSDGQLAYKVSGLHFQPDKKTENLGTYDLVINSDVARCLYGFTKAPISASVSITGGADQKIATTVVNEKNGWLKLAAYGFTYSEKVLQVKLSQEAEVKPTPTTKPVVAKKTTITCVKGKTSKKVTAVKPKCPTGFKKRA
jgi:hypothetical protein